MLKELVQHLVGMANKPEDLNINGRFIGKIAHADLQFTNLENHLPNPARLKAEKEFENIKGFCDYINRWKSSQTAIFADPKGRTVTAEIDYHKSVDSPSWREHKAKISFALDPDFQAWTKANGQSLSQRELVNFIIDYANDFANFTKADIVELFSDLKVERSGSVRSQIGNGSNNVQAEGNANLMAAFKKLPESFTVAVPVLKGFDKYALNFRIVWSIEDEARPVTGKIQLIRPHLLEEAAFNDVLDAINSGINTSSTTEEALADAVPVFGYDREKVSPKAGE